MTSNTYQKQVLSLRDRFHTITEDELFEMYKGYITKYEDEKYYYISTDFTYEFPESIGFSCYDIGALLKKKGVVTKGINTDHEYSCCYFYFKTRDSAERFARRLAKFIIQRQAVANDWGLFAG